MVGAALRRVYWEGMAREGGEEELVEEEEVLRDEDEEVVRDDGEAWVWEDEEVLREEERDLVRDGVEVTRGGAEVLLEEDRDLARAADLDLAFLPASTDIRVRRRAKRGRDSSIWAVRTGIRQEAITSSWLNEIERWDDYRGVFDLVPWPICGLICMVHVECWEWGPLVARNLRRRL